MMSFEKCCFLVVVLVIVVALSLPLLFGSFGDGNANDGGWLKHSHETFTRVVVIEGHRYVLAKSCYGIAIVHAESCVCKY